MAFLDFIDPGNSGGSVPAPSSPWDSLPPPAPVVYRCSVCNAAYDDTEQLFEHRFNEHPYTRPALILAGRELTSPRELVARPLSESQITLANTDHCLFDDKPVSLAKLPILLAKQSEGLHTIVLNRLGIETRYEIIFEIADEKELAEVDRIFLLIVGSETLSVDRINTFVEMAKKYKTALRYLDGLCRYLYGVLVKDQRGGSRLPQGEYKTMFNLALDALRHFDRPLAKVVVGVVNFSQNVFNDANTLSASPRLQHAMIKFYGFANRVAPVVAKSWSGDGMGNVPIDHATDQIVQWAIENEDDFLRHRRQMEASIIDVQFVPDDRFKVSLLLAERLSSLGQFSDAKRFARSLTNDALFSDWAQKILDTET